MNKNLTFIFCISNDFEKALLSKNTTYLNYKEQAVNLETESRAKLLSEPDKLRKSIISLTRTEFAILLFPEESLESNLLNIDEITSEYITAEIITDEKIKSNNLTGVERRIFSQNQALDDNPDEQLKIKILNYRNRFPELAGFRLKELVELYCQNKKNLSLVLQLIEYNYLPVSLEYLYRIQEYSYTESDLLSLYCLGSGWLIKENKLLAAKNLLSEALEHFPASPELNYMMGDLFFKTKKYEQSEHFFIKCVNMGLNRSYSRLRFFPLAIAGYAANYYLGLVYDRLGSYIHAKDSFEESLDIESGFVPAKKALDLSYRKLKESTDYKDEMDFGCQSCGNSCRFFSVEITHNDILRILENRPELTYDYFAEYREVNEKDDKLFLKGKKTKKSLILKKKKNKMDCVFLENNLCTVHEFKPLVCKVFPFGLRGSGNVTWLKKHRGYIDRFCAYTYKPGENDPKTLNKVLKRHYYEISELQTLEERWQKSTDRKEFIDFIIENKENLYLNLKQKLVAELTEKLKDNEHVKLAVKEPFISKFTKYEFDLKIELFVSADFYNSLSEETLKGFLSGTLEFDNMLVNKIIYHRMNVITKKNNLNTVIYISPESELKENIPFDAEIIINNTGYTLKPTLPKEIIQKETEAVIKRFNKGLEKGEAKKLLTDLLFLLYCINRKHFSYFDINTLKYKPEGLQRFLIEKYENNNDTISTITGFYFQILKTVKELTI